MKDEIGFEQQPFRRKHLEGEEPRKKDVVAVSLNEEERELLNKMKERLNCPYDSTVLKLGMKQLHKVVVDHLEPSVLSYLTSARRRRLL